MFDLARPADTLIHRFVPLALATGCLLVTALLIPATVLAQTGGTSPAPVRTLLGPPAPVAPAVITRDAAGHATVRAVKIESPLRPDGRLDEEVYRIVPSISDFIQSEPIPGVPATQKTEVWILFDSNNLYISARCWESNPERMIVNEMRRDANNVSQGERVGFTLDTFHDGRNGVSFSINPLGGRVDGQITDERQYNGDWNPVWDVAAGKFEGGWTIETQIPFKSLRYLPGANQVWGINISRHNRWKNEIDYMMPIPAGIRGLFQISLSAALVGLELPPASRNLELKPYVTSNMTGLRRTDPPMSNTLQGDFGGDVKYGITQSLTADATYNTDFAQVEADEQQVNLTRFNLFFPEKREFFLENQGMFVFGGTPALGQAVVGGDMPVLFYSRRIGLNNGRPIPIEAGGRVTGRMGRFTVGALNMQADSEEQSRTPSTNFSVVRVKRDLLRRSSVGLIGTHRSVGVAGSGTNDAVGADGTFAFFDNLAINTYWARTSTTGRTGDDQSYRAQLDYAGDRYGLQMERLVVGKNFNPEVGFVRRPNMHRSFGSVRFSPRTHDNPVIRKYSTTGTWTYIENGSGRPESREITGAFGIEFHNSDVVTATGVSTYEFLPQPFRVGPGVTLPVGGYHFGGGQIAWARGQNRKVSGTTTLQRGTFYNGHKTTLNYSTGRVNVTRQFSIEPNVSINRVDLVEGNFTTTLVGSRVTHNITTRMFVSALIQYSSDGRTTGVNARLRWEYRPGSELFMVYNEQRDGLPGQWTSLANRSFIIKINRLFRL